MRDKNKIAILIFFLITCIYLHPVFFGKVDTTTDIRNTRMYPWRYYAVDKKVKQLILWQDNKKETHEIQIKPNSTNKFIFKTYFSNETIEALPKLRDANYYLTFDFKPEYESSVAFDFGVLFINNLTKHTFKPGVAILPVSQSQGWYKGQFTLNDLIAKQKSVQDLTQYNIEIITKNKSNNKPAKLYVKNVRLVCEDFSKVVKVHNHYNNDLIQMFTPFREYYSHALKQGKLPFWNNYIFTGTEFLAEPQIGYFHPLYLLTYFIFDHFTAHSTIIFTCLFLCGFGAYLIGSYWGLGFAASVLTGIVYMFHPFNVTLLSYGHMILVSATLPFLLLAYEKNLKEERLLNKYLLASSGLLGLIFISGHLQIVQYTAMFFVLYLIFRFIVKTSKSDFNNYFFKHLFCVIFVLLFGLMISAIVLIPFYPLFLNSHRCSTPLDFVKITSIPLKAFLGLIYPFYQGYPDWPLSGVVNKTLNYENYKMGFFRNYVYFGFLPFLFSLLTIKDFFKNKLVMFLYLTTAFSILVCTGSPLYFWIRDFIPGFKEMQHYRFLLLYSYCVPFLSGIGLQIFSNHFSFLRKKIQTLIIILIILVSAIDLMFCSSYFVTWSDRCDYKPLSREGALEFILRKYKKSKEPFRVLPFVSHKIEDVWLRPDIAEPNTLLSYGIEDFSGYSSLIPKNIYYAYVYIQTKDVSRLYSEKIFDLFSNINTPYPISNFHSKIIDLSNVKYFIVPNFLTIDSPKVKKIFSEDCTIYENLKCFPRAFIVPTYKVIESPKDTIVELENESFDGKKEVILMAKPVISSQQSAISSQFLYNINFLKSEPENIILKVDTNQPGFLVLGHNLNNNWKVKVNEEEGRHIQANLVQRAVYLPKAGSYKIEFYYFPKLFLIGLAVTCFALLILICLGIYLSLRKKSKQTV